MKNILSILILSLLFACGRGGVSSNVSKPSTLAEKPNFICSLKKYNKISESTEFPGGTMWSHSMTFAIFKNSKLVKEEICLDYVNDTPGKCSYKKLEQMMKKDPRCQRQEKISIDGFKTMKFWDHTYVLIADNMDKDRAYGHTDLLDNKLGICNRFGTDWGVPVPKDFNKYMKAAKRNFKLKADILFGPRSDHFCSIEDQTCDNGKYNLSTKPAAIICQKRSY